MTAAYPATAERPDDDEWEINLLCCTDAIREEIAMGLPQMQIAVTYAMAMKSARQGADKPDWLAINTAILSKWKPSGLQRIKQRAHDILNGKVKL